MSAAAIIAFVLVALLILGHQFWRNAMDTSVWEDEDEQD